MLDLVAMPTEELVPTSNGSALGIKILNKVFFLGRAFRLLCYYPYWVGVYIF